MSVLIVAEHDNESLNSATLNSVTAANVIGGDIHILVAGHNCASVAEQAAKVAGVDPNWAALEKKLDAAATVDELIAAHDAFLDACLKEGMLFWPTTLRRLDVIAKTCVAFADAVASVGDDEEHSRNTFAKYAVAGEDADVARTLESLESSFDECVKELLHALNRSAHTEPNLSSLCARLDFNEYYTYGPGGKY